MDNNPVQDPGKARAGKKRGRPRKVAKKALLAAIKGSGGLIGVIAQRLEIPIRVLNGYLAIFPDAEKACRDEWDAREAGYLEMAERSLYKALNNGEAWAVRFVSSRPDKGKGFIQKMETVEKERPKHTPSDHAPESTNANYEREEIPEEWKRLGEEERDFISKYYQFEEIPEERFPMEDLSGVIEPDPSPSGIFEREEVPEEGPESKDGDTED